jgi:hypothetical protein
MLRRPLRPNVHRRLVLLGALAGAWGCARVDLREMVPPARLPSSVRLGPGVPVGLVGLPAGEIPPPASLEAGLSSLVPQQVADLLVATPWAGGWMGRTTPPWLAGTRRHHDLVTPLATSLLGVRPWRVQGPPGPALSPEAAWARAARAQGFRWLLVVSPALGPEDHRAPLPARLAVSAEVAFVDTVASRTLARGFDRVSVRVGGQDREALGRAVRRAGTELGRRLREPLGLPHLPPGEPGEPGEDDEP